MPNCCKACGAFALEELTQFRRLGRVASDCSPFPAGGRLLICHSCGAAQSPADNQWFQEIQKIYETYQTFQQNSEAEQQVLDGADGALRGRSQILIDRLSALPDFPRGGAVLDVGCGGGAMLQAFVGRGRWNLFGHELGDRDLPLLSKIAGFEKLFTCPLADLPRTFDVITMIHSLEHFPEPVDTLQDVRSKLTSGGRLTVEVPNAEANAFDYLIADHMLHFTAPILSAVAARAGFVTDYLTARWVSKELSLVARAGEVAAPHAVDPPAVQEAIGRVRGQLDWIDRLAESATDALRGSRQFGIFGSTIAATWLCGMLGDAVAFFVDEDLHRVGRTHVGRPILSPAQVPSGSVVYLAVNPVIAKRIAARLTNTSFDLRLPPD